MHFIKLGKTDGQAMIWAHGWGQNHQAMLALAQSFETSGPQVLVDFPGFGASPPPQGDWGTEDYADHMAGFIRQHNLGKVLWIGHSFGGRVGVQLAARHPDLISGMVLIAAAGLPRPQSFWKKLRVLVYKILKHLPINKDWLRRKFGSKDYLNAGALRGVFLKVVRENLSAQAAQIKCPVLLIYGEDDTETPPSIGTLYKSLIPGAEMVLLPGHDHYTVMAQGRHLTARHIKEFLEKLKTHDD